MFMGYLSIACPQCERKIRHHTRDLETKRNRICPGCGTLIVISEETVLLPPEALN